MPVTAEDVVWCYRTLLRREPESDAAVQSRLIAEDVKVLVAEFIASKEFAEKFAKINGLQSPLPLELPVLEIDIDASREQMAQLLARVRAAWTYLGEMRPHNSMLTLEKFLPESIGHNESEFWSSGELEAASIVTILARCGITYLSRRTCTVYGCGMGRVMLPLTNVFGQIHGYDISPTHLAIARQRATEHGISNAEFHLCSGRSFGELEKCDVLYSKLTFQHNPPPIIRDLIRIALGSLKAGGLAVFQVPIYRTNYSFHLETYLAHAPSLDMEMHCIPQLVVFDVVADAQCSVLEVREEAWADGTLSDTFVIRRGTARGE